MYAKQQNICAVLLGCFLYAVRNDSVMLNHKMTVTYMICCLLQMLAKCLMECYQSSSAAGSPLALKVFISGRGRLENEGSKALSEVFKVGIFCEASFFLRF